MKVLVIAACLINFGDDRGGVHHDVGDTPDVPKDTAKKLAEANRALYCNRKDDPTKSAQYTASEAMLKAADDMAKAKAKAAAEPKTEAKTKTETKVVTDPAQ